MRHQVAHRGLSRSGSHRKALLRSMATSLIREGSIGTTLAKARELKPVIEKLITTAKVDNLTARRAAYSWLLNKAMVHKLFTKVAPAFVDRKGGYCRIVKAAISRHGDAAEMAVIQLVEGVVLKTRKPAEVEKAA